MPQPQTRNIDNVITQIPAKGYGAHGPSEALAPFDFQRRLLEPQDVDIEILYCGVCHTDLHQLRNDWGFSIYPIVPGHEIVGRILAVGDAVKKFKAGDLAGVGCMVDSCRKCQNCLEGYEQFCKNGVTTTYNGLDKDGKTPTYGGYSNHIVVHEDFTLRISDKLPLPNVAPLLCAGITTYSPLKQWKIGPGHKVAIIGLGGLGHMALKFASAFGAEVTLLSTSATKEADAKKLGAHNFVLTTDQASVQSVTGHFDFILDTVAATHDYDLYLNMLKARGVMICVGIPVTPITANAVGVIFFGRSIAGSLIGGIAETQEMLDYCAEKNIVSDIEIIAMDKINDCFDRLVKGDVRYRFVIDMETL